MAQQNSNHRIARNMGLVAVFLFLAKLAGAAKEIVVALRFGVAEVVDAYLLTFTLLMWLPMVWTVVLATVYVPLSKRLGDSAARSFTEELAALSLLFGGVLALISLLVLPPLVPLFWSEFSVEGQQQLQSLFVGLAPMIVGVFLASLYAAQLLSLEKHSNSLFDGVPSLILALVILFALSVKPVNQFIVGSLLGVGLQVAGLALILRHHQGLTRIQFRFRSSAWRLFRNAIGIVILSQLIMGLVAPIDLFVAGQLGQGSIATFGYAQRILLLGMGLGATAVARAILPVLAEERSRSRHSGALVIRWSVFLWIIGALGAAAGWLLSTPVVSLLFERGAFTAEDTQRVASVLRYALFQLPWYFSGVVLVQYFASLERFAVLFWSSLLALTIKLLSVFVLVDRLGLEGIMVSSALMYFASWLLLAIVACRTGRTRRTASSSEAAWWT